MRVSMSTSGGHPGRPNEDFVGSVSDAAVLLDGAGIPGSDSVCSHGVAWYTHRLGGVLLGRLSRADGADLVTVLGSAIEEIADDHRGVCDIAHPISPSATVAIARAGPDRLDYLLLADCHLVLDGVGAGVQVVTDEREVAVRRACLAPLDGVAEGTPAYERVLDACVQALRARKNQPGGFWVAKDDPRAAAEAVTGSHPIRDLERLALLSNGAVSEGSPETASRVDCRSRSRRADARTHRYVHARERSPDPRIGFGTWQVPDGAQAYDAVTAALEAGYRHIDTARDYGNEASVGRA